MGRIIGIDLGTTNSVAAYWSRRRPKSIINSDNSSLTPSVVALDQATRYVGQNAKDRQYSGTKNIIYSVKRFIGRDFDDPQSQQALKRVSYIVQKAKNGEIEIKLGDQFYNPIEISAMILGKLKKDAELELGEDVTHAVITVPAYFSQRQKNATREAGRLAGLHVLRIINEPTAAALAFGVEENISEPQYILVYDLGGGTFDVSILVVSNGNFEVLSINGNNFLGGDDFDNLVIDEMFDQLNRDSGEDFRQDEMMKNKLKGHAEQIKINLSRDEQTRAADSGIAKTRKGKPANLDYSLTRARFDEMIAGMVQESIDIVNNALKKENMDAKEIDRVLLVGGSTRIPLVRRRLKELFGNKIQIDIDPMQCVALGAAIQTAIPIEWTCQNCKTVNEGTDEVCRVCQRPDQNESENTPVILCDTCGKNNRQGRLVCWSCAAKIGAVIEFDEEGAETESNTYIRIGDVTSKFLGVEVEGKNSGLDSRTLAIVIDKGTPYPTHEFFSKEFYTNQTGQNSITLPIFEAEEKDARRDAWEHVGVVTNDKLPAGTPIGTPVIIEMGIDADGILTVTSYLKKLKEDTLVSERFQFGSKEAFKDDSRSDELDNLKFRSSILGICAEDPKLNKHMKPDQIKISRQIANDAKEIVEAKDKSHAKLALERVNKQIDELPAPIWDLFWAYWGMEQSQISASERSQVNQTILQMENQAALGDFDQANEQLGQLRKLSQAMDQKIPSNLLKVARS